MREGNLALRFALELCLLAALAYVGLQVNVVFAVLAPVAAAAVWGSFVSPKARVPLRRPAWIALQLVLFGIAVVGLIATAHVVLAVVFAVLVAVNLTLVLIWDEDGTDTSHVPA
ncbi:MAG: YrdB family protein [Gaiellaceae bacterium]